MMHAEIDDLIASLLEEAPPSPRLRRWLATDVGRHELAAYRQTLSSLRNRYGTIETRLRGVAYYGMIHTPVGRILLAATDAGLVQVSFRQSEASFVAALRQRLGVTVIKSPVHTEPMVRQLRAYFAGARRTFEVPTDLRRVTPFQRQVLMAAARVPAGDVVTYGEIARRIGRPRGGRAVGQALGHNPIPIIIPCHRVVAAGDRLGGYTGGLAIKKKLLRLERAVAAAG